MVLEKIPPRKTTGENAIKKTLWFTRLAAGVGLRPGPHVSEYQPGEGNSDEIHS